jgi:hypothetical protein
MSTATMALVPVGDYYLRNVMETATAFRISDDHTFQFFFSQGALDRFGEGTWQLEGDTLVLNSRKRPAHDFALVKSSREEHNGVHVQITDNNDLVIRYVQGTLRGGYIVQQEVTDDSGVIRFGAQAIDTIELAFAFCPEKLSVFTVESKDHNYFEFRFEPWMMEYFFEDFKLKITDGELTGPNPMLNGDAFCYEKT